MTLTRRSFIRKSTAALAGGLLLFLSDNPSEKIRQPLSKKITYLVDEKAEKNLFENYRKDKYALYGIDPKIIIPGTESEYKPTEEQVLKELEVIIKQANSTPGADNLYRDKITAVHIVDSFQAQFGEVEDNEKKAQRLIEHSKRSIDHLLAFIGSERLQKPQVQFKVPKQISDIDIVDKEGITMYLLSGFGEIKCTWYNILQDGKKYPAFVPVKQEAYGESDFSLRVLTLEKGFEVTEPTHKAVFYRTSVEERAGLLETPAIEVLHRLLRPYTIEHIDKNLRSAEHELKKLNQLVDLWTSREEQIVHAASIVWWPHVNSDLGLGLTKEELEKRFVAYSKGGRFLNYEGTIQLAEKLKSIGLKKGIELYIENPKKLFEGNN